MEKEKIECFFNCEDGFEEVINDLVFTGEEVFTSSNLYNTVYNFYKNNQQVGFLGLHLRYLHRLVLDGDILVEMNCLNQYLDVIISSIFLKSIELSDLLVLTKDLYLSDYNEKYTSLLEKYSFVFLESTLEDKSLTYLEFIEDLCARDIFYAKKEKALYYYNNDVKGVNDADIVECLLEVYNDKRCKFAHKAYFALYLGEAFKDGLGVEIDYARAHYYLSIAASYDIEHAKLYLADLYTKGSYLGKEENVAYKIVSDLYEETKENYLLGDDDNLFAQASAKYANYLVNGIGVQKNEYYGYLAYLESFAAFENQINNNDENIDMNEFNKVIEYLNSHDLFNLDVRETPLSDFTQIFDDVCDDAYFDLKIKTLKDSYKFSFKLSDSSRIERLLIVLPSYDFSTVDDKFTFTVKKKDMISLDYVDTYIENISHLEYLEDGTIMFFDDEDNVLLSFNARNISYDFK